MKKIFSILISMCLILNLFLATTFAQSTDYKQIYSEYAKDADKNYSNKLNDTVSGLILVDLNDDKVPEMLAFSTAVDHYDEDHNQIFAFEEGYDNPAYKEYSHSVVKAFSIINGEVTEDSPWKRTTYSYIINMPFLPDEHIEDTEEFCGVFKDKSRKKYFCTYCVNSGTVSLWYDENGFGYSCGKLDNDFFDSYYPADSPVASIEFYDDEKQQKLTISKAMEMLLSKYENFNDFSLYKDMGNSENKISDWAAAEVNEAKNLKLIPQEMLNDDLTESITRAEFAAIAYKLCEAIAGEELNWHGGYIADIDDNIYDWYILGAYNLGITKGTDQNADGGVVFSPDLNITREQLATMLLRVIKLSKFEAWDVENDSSFPLDISNTRKFDDDSKISDYAKESVYYMSKHGIIKGVDNMSFAPLDTATKEQAILLALRIYNTFESLPIGMI